MEAVGCHDRDSVKETALVVPAVAVLRYPLKSAQAACFGVYAEVLHPGRVVASPSAAASAVSPLGLQRLPGGQS